MTHRVFFVLLTFSAWTHSATWTVGSGNDCDFAALQPAIDAASAGDEIRLNGELFTNTNVSISQSIDVIGGGQACNSTGAVGDHAILQADPGSSESVMRLEIFAESTLDSVQLEGGNSAQGGGLWIGIAAVADVNNVIVSGNSASKGGGVYVAQSGLLTQITNRGAASDAIRIANNSATDGGGLYVEGRGSVVFDSGQAVIESNSASNGGGVYLEHEAFADLNTVTIQLHESVNLGAGIYVASQSGSPESDPVLTLGPESIVRDNTADNGAGLYLEDGRSCSVVLQGAVSGHTATHHGGGLYQQQGRCDIAIAGGQFRENTANNGGGLYIDGGAVDIQGATIVDNHADNNGGAIYNFGPILTMISTEAHDLVVSGNHADMDGGALFLEAPVTGFLNIGESAAGCGDGDCIFQGNTTGQDGGAIWALNVPMEIWGAVMFDSNQAVRRGGGIYLNDQSLDIRPDHAAWQFKATRNGAEDGGFIYVDDGSVLMTWAQLGDLNAGNTATENGAAIHITNSTTLTLVNAQLVGNIAGNRGGGVFAQSSNVIMQAFFPSSLRGQSYIVCDAAELFFDQSCSLLRENAATDGAGIAVTGDASLTLEHTQVRDHVASSAIYAFGGDLWLRNVLLAGSSQHGVETISTADLEVENATIVDNGGRWHQKCPGICCRCLGLVVLGQCKQYSQPDVSAVVELQQYRRQSVKWHICATGFCDFGTWAVSLRQRIGRRR